MRWTKCCRTADRKKNARRANLRPAIVPFILLALLSGRAIPQETTLRAQSNVVLIPALVKDAQGEVVYGLTAKDFVIEDDGVEQMLDPLFSRGTARVAVVEFDSQIVLTQEFTKEENLVDFDLAKLEPGDGGAAILDAVGYSVGLLKKEPEDRLRVL